MKFIAFYFCATAGALRPVCCGDATGWPWHDFAASLGGGQPGQGENYSSVSWKASFRSCFGLLRRSGSSQITTRFYSKHVLFLLEVRSVSTRSTFCFYSKHVLFLLEARSASTRSTARTASSRCTCKCVLPCQNMSDGAWPLPRGTGSGQIMTKGRIQILVQVYSQKCWRMVLFYYLCNLNIHTIYISFNTL